MHDNHQFPINIGFLQFLPTNNYVNNICYLLKKLSKTRNTLIVLPEFFLTSYPTCKTFKYSEIKFCVHELLNLSYKNSLGLVGSLPIISNGNIYNRCLYINTGEILGKYDKTRLCGIENIYSPGKEKIGLFCYKGINFGVQICLDIINPIPLSEYTKKHNIDLLLVPAAISTDFLLTIVKARALENQIITILANRSKNTSEQIEYLGKSIICYPNGTKIQASDNSQTLKIISITKDVLMEMRLTRSKLM